jgi:hypothetical protein
MAYRLTGNGQTRKFAAVPPFDVRWWLCPTVPASLEIRGYAPNIAAAPGISAGLTVGRSHHHTSEGLAQDHID